MKVVAYRFYIRHSADLHISLCIFTFPNRLIRKTFILELKIPHSALQVYYNGISNEEGGLQPLLLLITINSFCDTYFYLQTSEVLSGKAFNSMFNILHFDVRNVSNINRFY